MMKLRLALAGMGLMLLSTACGEDTTVYQEPGGTVRGNVWDVSEDYTNSDSDSVEGIDVVFYYDGDGDGALDENYGSEYDFPDEWDIDTTATVETDANGNWECPGVTDGEYLVSFEEDTDTYADVDYVVDVFFPDDSAIDDETGLFADDAVLEQPLGVIEEATIDTNGPADGYVRIVLTWGKTDLNGDGTIDGGDSDYDAYWSFPRADYNGWRDDFSSPFYPDQITGMDHTAPSFCNACFGQGFPSDKFDNSTDTSGPTDDAGTNPVRMIADEPTIQLSENNGAAVTPNYGITYTGNFDISAANVAMQYGNMLVGDQGTRGLIYWGADGRDTDINPRPNPADPVVYTIENDPGTDTTAVIAVMLQNDSLKGSEGPETLLLGAIPNNNWWKYTGPGSADDYATTVGAAFGEGFADPAYEVGMGQYTVSFYSVTVNSVNTESRYLSPFAEVRPAVNIYNGAGERMWTFTTPEPGPGLEVLANSTFIPNRNWRPFYAMYQVEDRTGDGITPGADEFVKFIPGDFDNYFAFRSGVDGVTLGLGR